jgi:ABC-type branched-subunit amino acid transport system substrate-binding protein
VGVNVRRLFVWLFLTISIFAAAESFPQSDKAQFEEGLYYFKAGDYSNAIASLSELITSNNAYNEISTNLIIASNYYLGNFDDAIKYAEIFQTKYPKSEYLFDILTTQAIIFLKLNQVDKLLGCIEKLKEIELSAVQKEKLNSFLVAAADRISISDLEKIFRSLESENQYVDFFYFLYQKVIDSKNIESIKKYYSAYINARRGINQPLNYKIGVLFPLGDSKKITPGVEILEGLKFIVHRYNLQNIAKISLVILNTEGDETEFEKNFLRLVRDPDVICVVGPIYSDLLRKVSSLAEKYLIPIISPTATSSNLAEHRKFVIQFNPTYNIRGRAMAEYCINKLGLRKIVVLTQKLGFSNDISRAFILRSKELGIEYITEQIFDGTISDLNSQFINLRKKAIELDKVIRFRPDMSVLTESKLIRLGLQKELIDSLKTTEAEISIFELFGKYGDKICASEGIKVYNRSGDDVLNFEKPVFALDGIYFSISDRSVIKNLLSQFKNYGIRSSLFGSDAWNSIDDLLYTYPSSDEIIFTSDFFLDEESEQYQDLAEEFNSLSNLNLVRNVFYGIETMLKITSSLNSDSPNRLNLIEILQNDYSRKGFSSQIMLDEFGINSYLNILQFSNRYINKIDEIIAN